MQLHTTEMRQHTYARVALSIAAIAGLLHASASLYWALGGRWQLESVGTWAVDLARERPVETGVALGVVAVIKGVAALAPWLNERRRTRLYRPIRIVSWIGGSVLVVWGGVSALSAWAVLSGVVTPTGGYDRATMIGHGLVWDPLFAIWGVALLAGLWLTRSTRLGASGPTR